MRRKPYFSSVSREIHTVKPRQNRDPAIFRRRSRGTGAPLRQSRRQADLRYRKSRSYHRHAVFLITARKLNSLHISHPPPRQAPAARQNIRNDRRSGRIYGRRSVISVMIDAWGLQTFVCLIHTPSDRAFAVAERALVKPAILIWVIADSRAPFFFSRT